jgi:glycosyltransferase involved in cell wall biosynthesis
MSSSVSILTVTQFSRRESLKILVEIIKRQDYKNIKEWVISEGSPTEELASFNHIEIKKIIENFHLPIVYIEYKEGKSFSDMYNSGNDSCSGDIIVVMEDDDYYPPSRVSHAVEELDKSEKKIAGCSDILMYCYNTDIFYKFRSFGENHTCNHAMAYKREYLENHRFGSTIFSLVPKFSIERTFTNSYTEPIIQLDPYKTIIVSTHKANTLKRDEQTWINQEVIKKVDENILYYIPEDIFLDMRRVLSYIPEDILDRYNFD